MESDEDTGCIRRRRCARAFVFTHVAPGRISRRHAAMAQRPGQGRRQNFRRKSSPHPSRDLREGPKSDPRERPPPSALPQRVEDFPVVPDAQELVRGGDPVGLGGFGIAEDRVRDPYEPHHVAVQGEDFHRAVEPEAAVRPGLSKEYVDLVFLQHSDRRGPGVGSGNFLQVSFALVERLHGWLSLPPPTPHPAPPHSLPSVLSAVRDSTRHNQCDDVNTLRDSYIAISTWCHQGATGGRT